jgi:hypothetical protein
MATGLRWIVNFTSQLLYPWGYEERYPLCRRLGVPQLLWKLWRTSESLSAATRIHTPRLSSLNGSHCTYWAILYTYMTIIINWSYTSRKVVRSHKLRVAVWTSRQQFHREETSDFPCQTEVTYNPSHSISIYAKILTECLLVKLRGFSPQANYTDRATAACLRSWYQLLRRGCCVVERNGSPRQLISIF